MTNFEVTQSLDDKVKKLARGAIVLFLAEFCVILFLLLQKTAFSKEVLTYFSIGCYLLFFCVSKKHSHCWFLIEKQRTLTEQEKKEAWKRYFMAFAVPQFVSLFIFCVLLFTRF